MTLSPCDRWAESFCNICHCVTAKTSLLSLLIWRQITPHRMSDIMKRWPTYLSADDDWTQRQRSRRRLQSPGQNIIQNLAESKFSPRRLSQLLQVLIFLFLWWQTSSSRFEWVSIRCGGSVSTAEPPANEWRRNWQRKFSRASYSFVSRTIPQQL